MTAETTEIILAIEARGEIVSSNFPAFAEMVRARLGEINRDLATDDDFDQADADAKAIAGAEAALKEAKSKALADAEQLHALFEGIDGLSAELAAARLDLANQIKRRKEEVKAEIAEEFLAAFDIEPKLARRQFLGGLQSAIKGKRTVESMRSACRIYQATQQAGIVASREVLVRFEAKFGADSIPDRSDLELKSAEMVEAELVRRVQAKRAAEEAAKLQAESDKLKAEADALKVALVEAREAREAPRTADAELPTPHVELTAEEEWKAFKAAALTAFAPLKGAKGALTFPKNIAKAQVFASAINAAWQEVVA
jgi:hypothetical protein